MESFKIDVAVGPHSLNLERRYIDVFVQLEDDNDAPDILEEGIAGKFCPKALKINIDEVGNEERVIPETIGALKLRERDLGIGYVTHELTHALIWYCHILPFTDPFATEETEEMIAWELGDWNRQFWNWWNDLDK